MMAPLAHKQLCDLTILGLGQPLVVRGEVLGDTISVVKK